MDSNAWRCSFTECVLCSRPARVEDAEVFSHGPDHAVVSGVTSGHGHFLLGSSKALLWALVLVFGTTFLFGVCIANAVADIATEDLEEDIIKHWGSLTLAMDHLFKSATGGTTWEEVANELVAAGDYIYIVFLIYIAFFNFIVVNALCSIFVDFVRNRSERDTFNVIQEELGRKKRFIDRLKSLYQRMNPDDKGQVTQEEFKAHLKDPEMRAFASVLGIEATDLDQFFNILSGEGTRSVDLETFVVGAIKLKGMARSLDVVDMVIAQRRGQYELRGFMAYCRSQFQMLRADFSVRRGSVVPTSKQGVCLSSSDPSKHNAQEFAMETLVHEPCRADLDGSVSISDVEF